MNLGIYDHTLYTYNLITKYDVRVVSRRWSIQRFTLTPTNFFVEVRMLFSVFLVFAYGLTYFTDNVLGKMKMSHKNIQ